MRSRDTGEVLVTPFLKTLTMALWHYRVFSVRFFKSLFRYGSGAFMTFFCSLPKYSFPCLLPIAAEFDGFFKKLFMRPDKFSEGRDRNQVRKYLLGPEVPVFYAYPAMTQFVEKGVIPEGIGGCP